MLGRYKWVVVLAGALGCAVGAAENAAAQAYQRYGPGFGPPPVQYDYLERYGTTAPADSAAPEGQVAPGAAILAPAIPAWGPTWGGGFRRPYPYHLDYYRQRYGGSYAPYFGNLYGPPRVYAPGYFVPPPQPYGYGGGYYW